VVMDSGDTLERDFESVRSLGAQASDVRGDCRVVDPDEPRTRKSARLDGLFGR
jgi:hypothetical protein